MRIAIVSDIHGNLTALEAVLADLRQTSPDLILHGGDLADSGASPVEIVDRIRDLGWQGVVGNTDEMLFSPKSLQEFASQSPKLQPCRRAPRLAARPADYSNAWPGSRCARQSRESLAGARAHGERRRVRVGLRAARPAGCHLCAYPSLLHSRRCRNDRRQHRQR
jgi:3',5'-cyclic AMP phosphodiesterase CpdA